MLGFDEEKFVDEAAKKLPPALDPVLQHFAEALVEKLKTVLIGRTITIKIE